jgi:hypothetical protein
MHTVYGITVILYTELIFKNLHSCRFYSTMIFSKQSLYILALEPVRIFDALNFDPSFS